MLLALSVSLSGACAHACVARHAHVHLLVYALLSKANTNAGILKNSERLKLLILVVDWPRCPVWNE